jgi:hypothetical protein
VMAKRFSVTRRDGSLTEDDIIKLRAPGLKDVFKTKFTENLRREPREKVTTYVVVLATNEAEARQTVADVLKVSPDALAVVSKHGTGA